MKSEVETVGIEILAFIIFILLIIEIYMFIVIIHDSSTGRAGKGGPCRPHHRRSGRGKGMGMQRHKERPRREAKAQG